MPNREKKEAKEHAVRAARQMRYAARNTGAAAEAGAEHVKDEVVDGAVEAKNRVQDLAQKALFTEAGRGVLFMSVGIIAAGIGIKKFQEAKQMRENILKNMADPHIRPEV